VSFDTFERLATEVWRELGTGFPFYGVPWYLVVLGFLGLVLLLVFWNLVGKGRGSHAGREDVRRAYRRELARQLARQDADQIKAGQRTRRRWMQW